MFIFSVLIKQINIFKKMQLLGLMFVTFENKFAYPSTILYERNKSHSKVNTQISV